MAVNLSAPDPKTIFPVAGVELGTTMASIRKANRRDMMVMRFTPGTHAAGVFTQNRFAAAPVQVCRAHQAVTKNVRGLVVNTGIANAGTGETGLARQRVRLWLNFLIARPKRHLCFPPESSWSLCRWIDFWQDFPRRSTIFPQTIGSRQRKPS